MATKRPGGAPLPQDDAEPSTREILRRLWDYRHYAVPLLPPAVLLLGLALLQADLGVVGIALLARIVRSLAQAAGVGAGDADLAGVPPSPFSLEALVLPNLPAEGGLIQVAIVMAVFLLLAEGVGLARDQWRTRISELFRTRVQTDVVQGIVRARASDRQGRSASDTLEVLQSDTAGLASLMVFGVIGVAETVIQLAKYGYEIARLANGTVLALVFVLSVLLQGGVARLFLAPEGRAVQDGNARRMRTRGLMMQFVEQATRLVYFGGEAGEARRLFEATAASNQANRRFQRLSGIRNALSGTLTLLTFPLLVVALLLLEGGAIDAGTVLGTERLVALLTASVASLAALPSMLQEYAPSLERLRRLLDVPDPGPRPASLDPLLRASASAQLRLENVAIRVPGQPAPLLTGITLDIPAGACVGIVGASGSGKSTLARAIVGDLEPEAGAIRVDDVDVTRMPLWWRRELIGFLPADPGFLRGTLAENVRFGRSVEAVPNADEAIRLAGVDRIAGTREEAGGMHAPIRDPMEELSNGQRRRIGIARVLAGTPRVLIYDEPGSQLDPRSMAEVSDAIARAAHLRTSIVITHDPDVFRTDFNVFLAGGVIADVGPHAELLVRNAAYRELVEKQGDERARPRREVVPGEFPPRLGTLGREGGKKKASIRVS